MTSTPFLLDFVVFHRGTAETSWSCTPHFVTPPCGAAELIRHHEPGVGGRLSAAMAGLCFAEPATGVATARRLLVRLVHAVSTVTAERAGCAASSAKLNLSHVTVNFEEHRRLSPSNCFRRHGFQRLLDIFAVPAARFSPNDAPRHDDRVPNHAPPAMRLRALVPLAGDGTVAGASTRLAADNAPACWRQARRT